MVFEINGQTFKSMKAYVAQQIGCTDLKSLGSGKVALYMYHSHPEFRERRQVSCKERYRRQVARPVRTYTRWSGVLPVEAINDEASSSAGGNM